jgi:uncharacterized HAD superfamily protein
VTKKIETIISDIDDVLYDFGGFTCSLHNALNDTVITPNDIKDWDFNDVEMKDATGKVVRGKELYATYKRFEEHGFYSKMPLINDAKRALELMKLLGYKIILLTSRKEQFGEETYMNLLIDKIPYDELIFNWDKVKIIKSLSKTHNIRLFADDKLSTIEAVNDQCKVDYVCLVNKSHNQKKKLDENIIRVNGLFEAVRFLKSLKD